MPTTNKKKIIKTARLAAGYGMGPTRLAKAITSPQQKIARKNAAKLIKNLSASLPALPKVERDPSNPFGSTIATLRDHVAYYEHHRPADPELSAARIAEYSEAISLLQEQSREVRVNGKVVSAPGLYEVLREYCDASTRRREMFMAGKLPARGTVARERLDKPDRERTARLKALIPVVGEWVSVEPGMSVRLSAEGLLRVTWSR